MNGLARDDADLPNTKATVPFVARIRGRHLFALDMLAVVGISYLAIGLRFERFPELTMVVPWWPALAMLLVLRAFSNISYGLYYRSWRYASMPDVLIILTAVAFGSGATMLMFYGITGLLNADWARGLPRSFWILEAGMAAMVFGGLRFTLRAVWDRPSSQTRPGVASNPTLLYGAGRAGVLMARSARRYPDAGLTPVGFLDDDPSLNGSVVASLPVFGDVGALPRAVEATGAQTLLITMPSAPGASVRRVLEAALALKLRVRTIPPISELLDGSVDAYRVRAVQVEDLLRRAVVTQHAPSVEAIIRGEVVMITGAGGSIGSELVRQVIKVEPRRVILVDQAESPLYMLQLEVQQRQAQQGGTCELRTVLADVTNGSAMRRLITAERPSIIFHAAAYKHVPLLEDHPSDAVRVNIGGTRALLEAAEEADVERFVLVSTDKAVRPSSAMGATKRIAEMLVADAASRTSRKYVSVRFGNVLGSSGSVIPIFQEQLRNGQPLSITHPDMTRFFMTIPEAAWLILDAAALARTGDLFVLEMGEPVRIMDLARDLVRLAGRDPDSQPMVIGGLRPGEKLHEELFYLREQAEPTESPKVLRVNSQPPRATLQDDVDRLLAAATGAAETDLRGELLSYVHDENVLADAAPGLRGGS